MIIPSTPPRILIKREIYRLLSDMSAAIKPPEGEEPECRFVVKQDWVNQWRPEDWHPIPRLVVVYLDEIQAQGSYTAGIETATFTILCGVRAPSDDCVQAAEGLHFLAEQVRAAIWGHGDNIGLSGGAERLNLCGMESFRFRAGQLDVSQEELLLMFGEVSLSLTYNIKEYQDYILREAKGVQFKESNI